MSDPEITIFPSFSTVTPETRVKDLVKDALKEALEKKKAASEGKAISEKMSDLMSMAGIATAVPEYEDKIEIITTTAVVLKDGQKWFSDVIGIKVKDDFPVTCLQSYEWDEAVVSFIPDVDFTYHIDEKLSRNILMAWELNEKVLCYGPTGSGKSSVVEQLCARTGRPFIRVNCTGDMDSSMIFGQLLAKDGSTYWVDGAVKEAVKHGAVFAWDEWDVTPPEISMGLQWLLEDHGKLFLKDMPGKASEKMIQPHEHFRLVAIGNTQGQGDDTGAHAGTNVQNSATLDRFGTTVYIDYLPDHVEEAMLLGKCSSVINKKAAKELIKFANMVRGAYKEGQLSLTISPRTLFNVCNKLKVGVPLREATSLVYFNKLSHTQRKVADSLFTKVYGSTY